MYALKPVFSGQAEMNYIVVFEGVFCFQIDSFYG